MQERQWYSPCPANFSLSVVKTEGRCSRSTEAVWEWLSRKDTFTKGQIPPYRVEFMGDEEDVCFQQGNYNNHHGPFLHLPAHVTVMNAPTFREMQYLYGSYVLSYRLIRPISLRMNVEADGDSTKVIVELRAYTRPFVQSTWEWLNQIFWKRGFFSFFREDLVTALTGPSRSPLVAMGMLLAVWLPHRRSARRAWMQSPTFTACCL